MAIVSDIFVLITLISAASLVYLYSQDPSAGKLRGAQRVIGVILGVVPCGLYVAHRYFDALPIWPFHVASGSFWFVYALTSYRNLKQSKAA